MTENDFVSDDDMIHDTGTFTYDDTHENQVHKRKDNKRYDMVETNLISFKVYKQQAEAVQIETSDSHDLCFVDMILK